MVKATACLLLAARVSADSPCGQGSSECDDSPGEFGECCIDQSTYCIAPRGTFVTSTCCPRWTVGCTAGSVGCCDPARPWQLIAAQKTRASNATRSAAPDAPLLAKAEPTTVGFAIFTESLKSALSAATIDLSTGEVTSRTDVTGPASDWYALYFGESTRILPWDAEAARFVFADADLATGQLTVYTIDPRTGESTGTAVQGCSGMPVGMAWDADLRALVLTTQSETEAAFHALDAQTGEAKALGRVERGSDEDSEAFYAGYISHSHAGTTFRSGHQRVTLADGEGVGITELPGTSDVAKSSWKGAAKADAHGLPISMQRHPAGGFLSLAPRDSGKLDVVSWDVNGTAQIVAELGNANMPASEGLTLGYVTDAPVMDDTYAAMTVNLAGGHGLGDKWTVSTVSLGTGAVQEFALNPQPSIFGAEAVSVTGFGLPKQSKSVVV